MSAKPPPDTAAGSVPPASPAREPAFPRCPGETPRAFSAFKVFYQLDHGRNLQKVADRLHEKLDTVKTWSSKYRWGDRIQSYDSGLLQQQVEAEANARRHQAAEWARRAAESRELQFAASQKLFDGALCYLENIGDQEVANMSLGQASRALQVASRLASLALSDGLAPETPALVTLPAELIVALKKAYGQSPSLPADPASPSPSEPSRT